MIDIVCEIGVNHENSISNAINMIDEIGSINKNKEINLIAKFQYYKAEKLACAESPSYWDTTQEKTTSQRELFKKYDKFDINDYVLLASQCEKYGIEFMVTAFDEDSLELINPLVKRHKIASADITNIPLLRKIASYKKPIILSTGAASKNEIEKALEELKNKENNVTLLHCVLLYPTPDGDSQIGLIDTLKCEFPQNSIGYSDHTVPCQELKILKTVLSRDISLLEKHYTFNKNLKGNDHYHAMDINDLRKIVNYYEWLKSVEKNNGLNYREIEVAAINNARRSIVAKKKILKGSILNGKNLTTKRPGFGIPASKWDLVNGKYSSIDINEDTMIEWDMLK